MGADNYPDRKLLAALLPSYHEQIIETLPNLCHNPLKEMFGILINLILFDEILVKGKQYCQQKICKLC